MKGLIIRIIILRTFSLTQITREKDKGRKQSDSQKQKSSVPWPSVCVRVLGQLLPTSLFALLGGMMLTKEQKKKKKGDKLFLMWFH